MIRLVALACGLLCGAGFVLSGLYDPALVLALVSGQPDWPGALGLGLGVATLVGGLVAALPGKTKGPLLGGQAEPTLQARGWKPLVSALVFGLGWGLAGYFPLAALVAAGVMAPGAAIFLVAVLGGMLVHDMIAGAGTRKRGGRGSFG